MPLFLLIIIYVSFISLGLPDASLGVAWPAMYGELGVSIASAGIISFTVTAGTIISSLISGHVLRHFGTGRVNFFSTLMTGLAMVGFALSPNLAWILAFAIPLGLGAGSVDAGLNSYVALHYKAHHMNWLHSFWGLGATLGPVIMAQIIAISGAWRTGYWTVATIQLSLALVLFLTLPFWSRVEAHRLVRVDNANHSNDEMKTGAIDFADIASPGEGLAAAEAFHDSQAEVANHVVKPKLNLVRTPGLALALLTFFLYCGVEITMGLWGSSFLVSVRGMTVQAAGIWVSLYFAGIMAGRFLTGFLSLKWQTRQLIRLGLIISLIGSALILISSQPALALPGFIMVGLGFAPIFPGMIHETPNRFGSRNSQVIIGYQMASAYVGSTLFPPVIGWLAASVSLSILPPLVLVVIMALFASTEYINRVCR